MLSGFTFHLAFIVSHHHLYSYTDTMKNVHRHMWIPWWFSSNVLIRRYKFTRNPSSMYDFFPENQLVMDHLKLSAAYFAFVFMIYCCILSDFCFFILYCILSTYRIPEATTKIFFLRHWTMLDWYIVISRYYAGSGVTNFEKLSACNRLRGPSM
jgi:hypothetical protein